MAEIVISRTSLVEAKSTFRFTLRELSSPSAISTSRKETEKFHSVEQLRCPVL